MCASPKIRREKETGFPHSWKYRVGSAPMAALSLVATALLPSLAASQIQFEDATAAAGITYVGESYGSSWGDYNGDGWLDAWVSNHRNPPALYVNLGDGTFEDRSGEVNVWQLIPGSDQHGGTWSNFDNDGDFDLFISAGAANNSQFLVNDGQFLVDRTSEYTFDVQSWGGRMPVWFDHTRDGLLDFAMSVSPSNVRVFERSLDDFIEVNYGTKCVDNDYQQLSDVTRDGVLDWVCISHSNFPDIVYDVSLGTFIDQSSVFPPDIHNANETVFADFDGDLVSDVFILQGRLRVNGSELSSPTSMETHLTNTNLDTAGVSFQTDGDLSLVLHWNARSVNNILIGASGVHPPFSGTDVPINFTLSKSNPDFQGLAPFDSNLGKDSIYIGYFPGTDTWEFWNVSDNWSYVYAFIDSTLPINNVTDLDLQAIDSPRRPTLLTSATGNYVDTTTGSGLNVNLPCVSVVGEDFDNDGDVDLYMVCRNPVSNLANMLFENNNGVFSLVPNAGGAEGPIGFDVGLGENVTVADYDADGFVDLLVQNGLALYPAPPYNHGGPDKLFRNLGNANHWIEIDLVGTGNSNADAIGARVIANTNGILQLREQGGGYKRWAQNAQRLHFGLAAYDTVDLEITWPDGLVEIYNAVAADAIYIITQGQGIEERILPAVDPSACGPTGGLPVYEPSTDYGLFMGENCVTKAWTVEVAAGGGPFERFKGQVVSTEPFTSVTGDRLEANDTVDNITDPLVIDFDMGVGGQGTDGFIMSFPPTADVCFEMFEPISIVKVGAAGQDTTSPFYLGTLAPCSVDPPDCGLPVYDQATEQAMFVSRDCGSGVWQFRGTAGGSSVTYLGAVDSEQPMGVSGVSLEASDFVNLTMGGARIEYSLSMGGSGYDGFDVTLAEGAATCVTVDAPAGVQVFYGFSRSAVGTQFELETGGPCVNPPPSEEFSCGLADYDRSTEQAVFFGHSCSDGTWNFRMTAGGLNTTYEGTITSDLGFSAVNGFSQEGSDVIDTTNPNQISFIQNVGGSGQDGIDLSYPAGANVCVSVDAPPGIPVYAGPDRTVVATQPFNPETLGPCS